MAKTASRPVKACKSLRSHSPRITRLKIDQSFVRNLRGDTADAAVVRAVLFLAESFKLEAIAEGIETVEQQEALQRMSCSEGQGYLFGKAMEPADFEAKCNSSVTFTRKIGGSARPTRLLI